MAEEQLDFDDDDYGGSNKMQYHGGGAISALAEDETVGEDNEYDDLYNDVSVGEGFLQLQRSEEPVLSHGAGNGTFKTQQTNVPESKVGMLSKEQTNPGVETERNYPNSGLRFPEPERLNTNRMTEQETGNVSQKGMLPENTSEVQGVNFGFQGSLPVPQKTPSDNDVSLLHSPGTVGTGAVPQIPADQTCSNVNMNLNRPVVTENQLRPTVDNGSTMLYVGELHWWTTDAALESVLSQYGRVKEIKFFDERASGKSKGYCQVEFYESSAANACKERMNGHIFNGRACVVAFASPQTMRQMGASFTNKTQAQTQAQPPQHYQGRKPVNDGAGRGSGTNYSNGDGGRSFGRGGWGRGGQGVINRGPRGGPMRGRGAFGPKNMVGGDFSGGTYGQGLGGPAFAGGPPGSYMHPQSVMSMGFDPTYIGRGAGYGSFPGSAFQGMLPQFPAAVNTMGLAGVAPHVNPAFFGRGMTAANGMGMGMGVGMMGSAGVEAYHQGMWNDSSMGVFGGDEQHREKDREQDRHDKEKRYRDSKEGHGDHRKSKEQVLDYEDDWDQGGQSSSRSWGKLRAIQVEDHRSQSTDADYGKRRRAD